MTALELRGVGRQFGALRAVDDVDLTVAAGTRHGLIGPNGAGKSTLFKLIAGTLRVSAGSVLLAGRDVTGLRESQRARLGISQTLQHSSLFLPLSVQQNVLLAAQRRHGNPGSLWPRRQAAARDRMGELLAAVGLSTRRSAPAGDLSHGERRQLEIAVALACEPSLLLLDEPAAGMSPAEGDRLVELVQALPREVTVLIVEHDLDVVFRVAESVTVLHLGQVLLTGSPSQVRESASVREAYLGTADRAELFVQGGPG
ncbi:MAG: ABC transporter ATP-binding protein [Geodermatophilaceae bacterium]|nr:ABC transporter ATP-binding protein [Geodermatophilaceae bacterium]MDQ3454423.1 ABC transporter ATP-binding protein [Actinomycetota bacterium]